MYVHTVTLCSSAVDLQITLVRQNRFRCAFLVCAVPLTLSIVPRRFDLPSYLIRNALLPGDFSNKHMLRKFISLTLSLDVGYVMRPVKVWECERAYSKQLKLSWLPEYMFSAE
ncbi:hypothetical protein HYC85_008685 [Camellia sinensis]|uniref:Uncharacterized protein n=1 Tax=Camellia sinensis TaxID=4442 RepID=A0A7J7HT45_CAMSI|nr:hypothetical protein HYC85_008685 [Camellia sinensis]